MSGSHAGKTRQPVAVPADQGKSRQTAMATLAPMMLAAAPVPGLAFDVVRSDPEPSSCLQGSRHPASRPTAPPRSSSTESRI
jgi:hypothetical protein